MLGRRLPSTPDRVIALKDLPPPPANPFYTRLNTLLDEASFEPFVEELCRPYYAERFGRPSVPPGVYFRMLLLGYFEGLGSQRAIAWHCADSRSAQAYLGLPPHQATPDHSSLTKIRQRLPEGVHEQVFVFVLKLAEDKGLIPGKTVGVDSTMLQANAALKTIVRRDNGDDWKEYLRKLAAEAGLDNPTDEELRRFDRQRKDKKVSNDEWTSPSDPDSKIAKMKDGTTHLAYKAEHVVDLQTELILAAPIYPADQPDSATLLESVVSAQVHLIEAETELPLEEVAAKGETAVAEVTAIEEAVADKGYHKAETLADCRAARVRTYIPEKQRKGERVWTDKPPAWEKAYRNNRRRLSGNRSKRLQKLRSEKVERTFAHVCESGGARRSWLRGLVVVGKRYLMAVAGHNLGIIMRRVFSKGTPKSLQGLRPAVVAWIVGWRGILVRMVRSWSATGTWDVRETRSNQMSFATYHAAGNRTSSTGC
jgi:transposase